MKVIPDSNLILALVISLPYSEAARRTMQQWQEQNIVGTLYRRYRR